MSVRSNRGPWPSLMSVGHTEPVAAPATITLGAVAPAVNSKRAERPWLSAELSSLSFPKSSGVSLKSSDNQCHVFELKNNGMKIIWVPYAQGQKVSVRRIIEGGSSVEPVGKEGWAHAYEHFLYKDGAAWTRFLGCNINARTSNKHIVTEFDGPLSMLFDYLDYQVDTMQGKHVAAVTEEQFRKEIQNILDEKHRNQSPQNAFRHVLEGINRLVLRQGNTKPTIGFESTLKNMKLSDLKGLHNLLSSPARNTLVVVGGVPSGMFPDSFVQKLVGKFSNVQRHTFPDTEVQQLGTLPMPERRSQSGLRLHEIRKGGGSTIVALGWPSPAWGKDSDVLQVINQLISAPPGIRSITKPLEDRGLIHGCHADLGVYSKPDAHYILALVPASSDNEAVMSRIVETGLTHLIGHDLLNFNDHNMLQSALQRLRHKYMTETSQDSATLANSVVESVFANGEPSLTRQYNQRFGPNSVSVQDIRRVANERMNEHNLVLLRYLQHALPTKSPLLLAAERPLTRDNDHSVRLSTAEMAGFDFFNALVVDGNHRAYTRPVVPYNRSYVTLLFKDKNLTTSWAAREVTTRLLNKRDGDHKLKLHAINSEVEWATPGPGVVACMIQCNRDQLGTTLAILDKSMRKREMFSDDLCLRELGMQKAMTRGTQFNAQKLASIAMIQHLYDKNDFNYKIGIKDQLDSVDACTPQHLNGVFAAITNITPETIMVNIDSSSINMVRRFSFRPIEYRRPRNMLASGRGTTHLIGSLSGGSRHINVANTPSASVFFGTRTSNIAPGDTASIARLKLATTTLGNSFAGRLMKEVRDQHGYTYGISPMLISAGDSPRLLVYCTLNKDVKAKATALVQNILQEFSSGQITEDEIHMARVSLSNSAELQNASNIMDKLSSTMQSHDNHTDPRIYWRTIQECSCDSVRQLVKQSLSQSKFAVISAGSHAG